MPALRTDDGPRKLRAVWLGPKGATLPFEWTYVQWAVTIAVIPAVGLACIALLMLLATVLTGSPQAWFTIGVGAVSGVGLGSFLAVHIMRGVTYDEPVRYKRHIVQADWSRKSRKPVEKAATINVPFPRIRDFNPSHLLEK